MVNEASFLENQINVHISDTIENWYPWKGEGHTLFKSSCDEKMQLKLQHTYPFTC